MKFYVFNSSFETLGVISNYESMTHVRQFAGSGSFKLKAPFTKKLFNLLIEDNVLYWEDCGRPRAVYIDSVICEGEKNGDYITASGKNLRGLLERRIVWSNVHYSGTVEDFGRQIVTTEAITPAMQARAIPLLYLAERKGLPQTITRLTENENVETLLDDITAASDVGFDIVLDKAARRMLFTVYEGVDRRTTQNAVPWVIVSRDRNNVVSEVYTRSGVSFRNSALILGYTEEETETRYEAEINEGSGLARREIFLKGNSSKPKPEEIEQYTAELLQKGLEKLAAQVNVESLEVEPEPALLERLDVGDKVTAIERTYNLMAQTYVSEITTYYGSGGRSFDITLGDAVPTIYKKMKKEIE